MSKNEKIKFTKNKNYTKAKKLKIFASIFFTLLMFFGFSYEFYQNEYLAKRNVNKVIPKEEITSEVSQPVAVTKKEDSSLNDTATNNSGTNKTSTKNANKSLKIEIGDDYSKFNFEQAVKGSKEEKIARKKSAINLIKNGHAKIITAYKKNKMCAGIFIATDNSTAYIMHSWQSDDAPRGTMSALICKGATWAFKEKCSKRYDFEGSIIQNVDYYYSGFNCKIESYGYVFWSTEKKSFDKMIEKSINIPERLLTT